jgi:hypothetical protein
MSTGTSSAHERAVTDLATPLEERHFRTAPTDSTMRSEEEIREQYEFLLEELDDEDMKHEGVKQMFTYYKRALGWVLEEEHI